VVINKADTLPEKEAKKIANKFSKEISAQGRSTSGGKQKVLIISAVSGTGVKELLEQMA
jgi:putative protein kinase ArgK-like GTPase of G3E family